MNAKAYTPYYGDLTELNTERTILDLVGKEAIQDLTSELMDLLKTSVAIYEKNGDYAYGEFDSAWCQLLDAAARKQCNTDDNKKALTCGKWLCHDDCWNNSAKAAMTAKKSTDIQCIGAINLYAEPIFAEEEVIGVINIGYGNPPTDDKRLYELSEKYNVDFNTLKQKANAYEPRPEYIINATKKRLKSIAQLIGEIVSRKRAEQALIESERKFKTVFEKGLAAIVVADDKGNYTSTNKAASDLFGYSTGELATMNVSDLQTEVQPGSAERYKTYLKKGEETGEFDFLTKNGENKVALYRATRIAENFNLSMLFDITNRKKAEQEIIKAKSVSEKYLDIVGNIIIALNRKGEITLLNRKGHEILNYNNGELYGKNWFTTCLPKEIHHEVKKYFNDIINGKEQVDETHENEIITKDGQKKTIKWYTTIVKDDAGTKTGLLSSGEDITEKKKTEKKLKESEEKFKTIFEMSLGLMCIADIDTATFKVVNPAFKNVLGYNEEELLNRPFFEFIHPNDVKPTQQVVEKELKAGKIVIQFQNRYKHKDGTYRWLNWNSHPIPEKGITYAIAHDITEIKKNQLALIKAKEQLEENEKNLQEKNEEYESINEELKQTNEELYYSKELAETNEDKFKKLFNNVSSAIFIYHPDTFEIIEANRATSEIYGYSNNELIGMSCLAFSAEVEKSKTVNSIANENEKYFVNVRHHKKKDGTFIFVQLFAHKIQVDNTTYMFAVSDNITEKIKSDKLMRQNKNRLEILLALYEMSQVEINEIYDFTLEKAVELCDSKIGFLGFPNKNETKVRMYAWSSSVMKSCKVEDKYLDFDVEKSGIWSEAIRQRKPFVLNDFKAENPLKRGTPKGHVEIDRYLSIPVFDNKKIVAVIALGNKESDYNQNDVNELTLLMKGMWNIVKQKNYEQDLLLAKENAEKTFMKMKTSLESMSDAVFISDNEGNFIDFNEAFATFHKFGSKNECRKSLGEYPVILDVFYPDGKILPLDMWVVSRALRGEIGIGEEYILKRKDINETWVGSYNYAPIKNNKGDIIGSVVTARDISEQKKWEKEIVIAKEKAEEANLLKTEFLNNMSHEVRTPMNGIIGFSGMLDKPNITDEKRKYFTKIIQNSSHQLLRIINDILEISTLETKQKKISETAFCLNDLLMELFSVFNLKAKERKIPIYLKKALHDHQSHIMSDNTKLNKILSNLLENALKYTHEGYVEFGYYLEKTNVVIYVKDTGIGISPKNHNIIFERFSQEVKTSSREYGGLGLGLSISKENAQLLGGNITLKSEKGLGATFYVTIPYKPLQKTALGVSENTSENSVANKEYTILVAEDEEVNYMYIETILEDKEDADYNIIHAKNGKEAVDICFTNKNIDLVLMDIKMPIMNGYEATEKIKSKLPDLPIIAQTAYSTESDKQIALDHGCDEFISKPISEEQFFNLINKYLKKEYTGTNTV